jgi:ATP synthase protein I
LLQPGVKQAVNDPIDHAFDQPSDPDAAQEAAFKPLTREEASVLKARWPSVSPWHVIAVQAAVGVLCALVAWGVSRSGPVMVSALYGAAVVVLPGSLLARGMARGVANPAAAAAGFLFWELVKIGVAVGGGGRRGARPELDSIAADDGGVHEDGLAGAAEAAPAGGDRDTTKESLIRHVCRSKRCRSRWPLGW